MGIGNKPFMDIKPSEAAISDRSVHCITKGKGMSLTRRLTQRGTGFCSVSEKASYVLEAELKDFSSIDYEQIFDNHNY